MNFHDLITSRQSVRKYKDKTPAHDELAMVVEAARMAPSAVNFQPWEFIVVTDDAMMKKVHTCYHREWFATAPACIIALGKHAEAWTRPVDDKDHTDIDLSIAIDHLTLQATELGLGTCWVCNFDVEKVKQLFSLAINVEAIALIPIGYPVEELKPEEKKRKPIEDIVRWV